MKTNINLNPTIVVIFGGTGDLNLRKLAPALYNLCADGYMPEKYAIIGTARKPLNDQKFRTILKEAVSNFSRSGTVKDEKWDSFSDHIYYTPVDVESPETFGTLRDSIEKFQKEFGEKTQVIYYLSVAPNLFPLIAKCLAEYKLAGTEENTRIVIEKPFGRDLETAKELNCILTGIFTEKQI